jgi:hypothetical protein
LKEELSTAIAKIMEAVRPLGYTVTGVYLSENGEKDADKGQRLNVSIVREGNFNC